jgi:hypothetical protein
MSKHQEIFQIPLPPEQAKNLCGHALASLGHKYADLGYGYSCGEDFQFGFTWPVTMTVIINHGDAGTSQITIAGSNFGFGPIQSSHVRGKVVALRQRIEQMAAQPPPPPANA